MSTTRSSKRYEKNMMTLSPEENEKLATFKVFVAGCGGLGGYVIEELARLESATHYCSRRRCF